MFQALFTNLLHSHQPKAYGKIMSMGYGENLLVKTWLAKTNLECLMEEGIETMRGLEKFQVLICGGRKETKNFTEWHGSLSQIFIKVTLSNSQTATT